MIYPRVDIQRDGETRARARFSMQNSACLSIERYRHTKKSSARGHREGRGPTCRCSSERRIPTRLNQPGEMCTKNLAREIAFWTSERASRPRSRSSRKSSTLHGGAILCERNSRRFTRVSDTSERNVTGQGHRDLPEFRADNRVREAFRDRLDSLSTALRQTWASFPWQLYRVFRKPAGR